VLTEFHRVHPSISGLEPKDVQRELEALSERVFAPAVARNYLAQAWLTLWKGLIPHYLPWQRAREAEGWTWQGGEVEKERELTTPQGARLTLRGRLDRVDSRQSSAVSSQSSPDVAVIDYKTGDPLKLKQALESPGEDVQLPVYALLWGAPVAEALFLSMARDKVREVGLDDGVQALADAERERLGRLFDALAAGAGLPAQGTEPVCEYCDVRGLCRKNYWP
jgi:ATP-dependent helicase/nuclease subunit B